MDREPPKSLTTPSSGTASTHQLETIARMVAMGSQAADIARLVGMTVPRVNTLIRGGANRKFDQLKEDALDKLSKANAGHVFRLLDMSESAYTAYESIFHVDDPKLKADHAKDWMNRCFPEQRPIAPMADQPGGVHNTQFNIGITKLYQEVMEVVPELSQLLDDGNPRAHILSGEDALPRPPGQLEVLDTDSLPGPDETDDSLDLKEVPEGA